MQRLQLSEQRRLDFANLVIAHAFQTEFVAVVMRVIVIMSMFVALVVMRMVVAFVVVALVTLYYLTTENRRAENAVPVRRPKLRRVESVR